MIYRIQASNGSLKGDGKVGESYDMSWWGKCHNVAAIGASSIKMPQSPVKGARSHCHCFSFGLARVFSHAKASMSADLCN